MGVGRFKFDLRFHIFLITVVVAKFDVSSLFQIKNMSSIRKICHLLETMANLSFLSFSNRSRKMFA